MNKSIELRNLLIHLRLPFSFLLMPLFLLAWSQIEEPYDSGHLLLSFAIIHLLVYPSSNAYNSYMDRDTGSIGGIEKPPPVPEALYKLTLFLDSIALALGCFLLSWQFALAVLVYILASRAYSSRAIRIKAYAWPGFLLVFFFQGAFTYYMSYWGIVGKSLVFEYSSYCILAASSFQIGAIYPLTQIYQHVQDKADGVETLSYRLGYRGTFLFSACSFLLSVLSYYLYFSAQESLFQFAILQLFLFPVLLFFLFWAFWVWRDVAEANFRNTMRINLLAALCMNSCFLILGFFF